MRTGGNNTTILIDSILIPSTGLCLVLCVVWGPLHNHRWEYMAKEPITTTGVRLRLAEFERSPAMLRLQEGMQRTIDQMIERVYFTPIQFRFPRSKKKRIRKKWRKDPRNFRKLLEGQPVDIEIVGIGG